MAQAQRRMLTRRGNAEEPAFSLCFARSCPILLTQLAIIRKGALLRFIVGMANKCLGSAHALTEMLSILLQGGVLDTLVQIFPALLCGMGVNWDGGLAVTSRTVIFYTMINGTRWYLTGIQFARMEKSLGWMRGITAAP